MNIEPVSLEVDGLEIAGQFYRPEGKPPYHAVAICHGLPARVKEPGDRGYADLAERFADAGLAACIFNFRGAGSSQGNLDMWGWPRDLAAVIDHLIGRREVSRVSLLGFSAGAAVAIFVGARDERVAAVAAGACPCDFDVINQDNVGDAIEHYRGLGVIRDADFPPSHEEWLAGFERVKAIDYVAGIAPRPLLLVHGTADDVVDISHSRRLYDAAGEPKQLVVIDGAGHRLRHDEQAVTKVIDWLRRL